MNTLMQLHSIGPGVTDFRYKRSSHGLAWNLFCPRWYGSGSHAGLNDAIRFRLRVTWSLLSTTFQHVPTHSDTLRVN